MKDMKWDSIGFAGILNERYLLVYPRRLVSEIAVNNSIIDWNQRMDRDAMNGVFAGHES